MAFYFQYILWINVLRIITNIIIYNFKQNINWQHGKKRSKTVAVTAGFLAHLMGKKTWFWRHFFLSIFGVLASFMEISYWSAMVLANSSFKVCRSVVKSLSLFSKFSNSCSTYIFLSRGVMLQLFPGSPERWCISARMNTRTFWPHLLKLYITDRAWKVCVCHYYPVIVVKSFANPNIMPDYWINECENKRVHWRITEFWGSANIYGGSKQYIQYFPTLGFW